MLMKTRLASLVEEHNCLSFPSTASITLRRLKNSQNHPRTTATATNKVNNTGKFTTNPYVWFHIVTENYINFLFSQHCLFWQNVEFVCLCTEIYSNSIKRTTVWFPGGTCLRMLGFFEDWFLITWSVFVFGSVFVLTASAAPRYKVWFKEWKLW